MAPELFDDNIEKYDKSVDVFSFGMLVYKILTGKNPFHERSKLRYFTIGQLYLKGKRPIFNKQITNDMQMLLTRCWSSDPKKRPSFDEIFELLSSNISIFIDGEIDKDEIKKLVDFLKKKKRIEAQEKEKRNPILDVMLFKFLIKNSKEKKKFSSIKN